MLSNGFNRRLIEDKPWEVSAVYDAIFSARDIDLTGASLFISYFPTVDDLKLILAVGINSIYFSGKIDDKDSVALLNCFEKNSKVLEITQLF